MATMKVNRWPKTDDELWETIATIWDRRIPRIKVCPHHCPPFQAIADAYFARSPMAVWKASRGFGGKSTLLALLGQCESVFQGASVNILGGSGQQSKRVLEEMAVGWGRPRAPRALLLDDPGKQSIRLSNGGKTEALMASQASVRGPHPQRLRLDEVDEMKLPIFDAALGQTMAADGIQAQTVISSTHQYPDGTMTEVLRRAAERGWPIYEWCWRDTLEPGGWLMQSEVERKRLEVPSAMWSIEYDLQEPIQEGLAFDRQSVDAMFRTELGEFDGREGEYIEIEIPVKDVRYVTGADWAKEKDWTVIPTYRTDQKPWKLVAFERLGRRPWPMMVKRLDERVMRFPGPAAHDALGIGNVVGDLVNVKVEAVLMVGRARHDMFTEYISAVERGEIVAPMIKFMYNGHRYCSLKDLFGSGHPPDDVVAAAIAWTQRKKALAGPHKVEALGERVTSNIPW